MVTTEIEEYSNPIEAYGLENLTLPPINRTAAKAAADLTGKDEIRFLVNSFYQMQNDRIRTNNQIRSLKDNSKDNYVIQWFSDYRQQAEDTLEKVLTYYVEGQELGRWLNSILGIGPLISAGLLAYIDIDKAPYVGHIWRYAGLDPTHEWLGKEKSAKLVKEMVSGSKPTREEVINIAVKLNRKADNLWNSAQDKKKGVETGKGVTTNSLIMALAKRPYNADLKTLCYKISDQLCIRQVNNPKNYYAPMFLEYKAKQHKQNDEGRFAEIAERKIGTVGKSTKAGQAYAQGRLSDGEIQMRSRRWLVKLFLSHYHHVAYEVQYGETPPKPYVIEHLGHAHYMAPPNWPM